MVRRARDAAIALLGLASACSRPPAEPTPREAAPLPPQRAKTGAPPPASRPADAGLRDRPTRRRPEGPLNVVLILVDSMRADMPWAGYPRDVAPTLTEMEKESVSYTRAHSISSYTAKSLGGLLSGKYPSSLPRTSHFFTSYSNETLFFPEVLEQAGVRSLAVHGHTYMGGKRNKGLAQGFHTWQLVRGLHWEMPKREWDVTSHKITPLATKLLDAVPADRRFFLYVHYMDPHHGYQNHAGSKRWGDRPRDRYDAEMFYTDGWLKKLVDHLRARADWSETVVVVSADHGDAFGEHGQTRHAFTLWETVTHVPLFFYNLPGAPARRIDEPRSHIDLAPTILDLMGAPPSPDLVGESLVGELYGAEPTRRPVLLDLPKDDTNPELRAVIDGDHKLIVSGKGFRRQLFNLAEDPGELVDLARKDPAKLEHMKGVFEATWGKVPFVRRGAL